MSKPWLTVALTTYNAEDYLAEALDGVVDQDDGGVEIIGVDDASSDRTIDILESYRPKLDLTVVRRGARTANWMASHNEALRRARGEYVCFLHHDDYWLRGRLAAAKAALARSPDTVLLLHPAWFIDDAGQRLGQWRCPLPSGRSLAPDVVVERLLTQNFVPIPAALFRRDAAIQVGGLDETLWYSGDWDFWLKLAAIGKTTYLPQPLAAYRIHNHSMTWWRTEDQIGEQRRQMEQVLEEHARALGVRRRPHPARLRAARFSIEVNSRLASFAHGHRASLLALAVRLLALGPVGCGVYFRDSRIVERVASRLRAGMLRWSKRRGPRAVAPAPAVVGGPASQ